MFHHYDLIDESTIQVKRCREDEQYCLQHNLLDMQQRKGLRIVLLVFVACG